MSEETNTKYTASKNHLEQSPKSGVSFGIGGVMIGLSMVLAITVGTYQYTLNTLPTFVTISVSRVIESQTKAIDREMIHNNIVLSEIQIEERIKNYTHKISRTLTDYSKKNRVIIFEKGAIISDGVGIKDITDTFIEAINEE